ncbi:MAG: succinate dehydrogenase, cytochrome b556 subunit [Acidobacteria bacterium]|nr:succinate dehydrogenase, cytochrome b556 subunit [Acidobacteriota bacterium]
MSKYTSQFAGGLAQILQRVTGVLLLAYLLLHVHTIHKLSEGPQAFDMALDTFRHPLVKLLEIALLGTVILHSLNGVRITLLDLGIGHDRQRQLFWALSVGAGLLVFLLGAVPIFLHSVLKV